MSELKKTIWFTSVAVVVLLLAIVFAPSRIKPDAFLDQGEPFFPDFTDPNEATSLEVVQFDEESGTARPFNVHFYNNQWTIPSHHDYPADAKDRLARTAAGVIGIKKDDFRTGNVVDHEACGVIDPMDENSASMTGRGSRITLKGEGGKVLADFIVGKEVPGRSGFRFVRIPGQNRVYASKMNLDISTKFTDWINTDLLEVDRSKVVGLGIEDYSINERTLSLNRRDRFSLVKNNDVWKFSGRQKGQNDKLDTAKVKDLASALQGLKIAGVRPKPQGLSANLTASGDTLQMTQEDRVSLQSKGFYMSNDGGLVSNEGELKVKTSEGIDYTLRFGEVLYGSGLSLTAGGDSQSSGKDQEADQGEYRYLFVTAGFDQSYFKPPPKPSSTDFKNKPDSLWTDADKQAKAVQDAYDKWEQKVADGRDRAAMLNRRFAPWYYVISADSFEKVHLKRSDLIETKS